MRSSEKLSRFFQGTAVVLALGMLLVVGVSQTQQEEIELEDFSFELGRIDIPEGLDELIKKQDERKKNQKHLEKRIVDPFIDFVIEENLKDITAKIDRSSFYGKQIDDTLRLFHSRSTEIVELRKDLVERIVTPILDMSELNPEHRIGFSFEVRGVPHSDGTVSWGISTNITTKNNRRIPLSNTNTSTSSGTIIELEDFSFSIGQMQNIDIVVTCTKGKYQYPIVNADGWVFTSISHECEHDFRSVYPGDNWIIKKQDWIYTIELFRPYEQGGEVAMNLMRAANQQSHQLNSSNVTDPPNPVQLADSDSQACSGGPWYARFTVGLTLVVEEKYTGETRYLGNIEPDYLKNKLRGSWITCP